MKLKTFVRLSGRGRQLAWTGTLVGLLLAAGTTAFGDLSDEGKRRADARRESLSLFAGPTAVLSGNQLQCGIANNGDVCANVFNSPTGGGGFWPTGSQNQYIFNTGLQVAGIMGPDAGPWANDTTGAFFFDASGNNESTTALTNVFNSLDPEDAQAFETNPALRVPEDPDLFQEVLQGRPTASQQDSWVQYWDGDPSAGATGREHPLGITVTQRSLAWNYPAGNESLIYFLYNFQNTTAVDNPQGAEFQALNEAQFFGGANLLPDAGITFTELYAAFATDMDVTSTATANMSTAVLPFDLGISYHGGFSAPNFSYPPELFSPPFFTNAPGLIGVKYLRSPVNPETGNEVGLTLFSATLNPSGTTGGFPDPSDAKQLWRYLSGKVNPSQGDTPCNITAEVTSSDPAQVERSLCFLSQTADDTRFFQASGPFAMEPGEEATIVVAYIAAATVATLPDGSPSGISANDPNDSANPPGEPSFHPGFPSARGCPAGGAIPADCTEVNNVNDVKPLERGAGWVSYDGPAPGSPLESADNKLDQRSVNVVPGSMLGKALVAQTIFDSRFLLGFAPEQPTFWLVPGNNQVTVLWEESASEDTSDPEGGDPFFTVASDTASALFNPNYRQFDVEGYRVWRGTSSGQLTLLAQFDYASTSFTDLTCETVEPDEDAGALRIDSMGDTVTVDAGFAAGEICPEDFSKSIAINSNLVFNNGGSGGNPGDGVARLIDGSAAYSSDPMVAIEFDEADLPRLPLSDGGVPFVFVDETVTNNFTYFYAVSVFDVNSPASGPHSLRSARVTKTAVPRADAPNLVNASLEIGPITGDDGVALDTDAPDPEVDAETGIFDGMMPPTDAYTNISFAPLLTRLLPQLNLAITIDSVIVRHTGGPGGSQEFAPTPTGFCNNGFDSDGSGRVASAFGACWEMYFSGNVDGEQIQSVGVAYNPWWSAFGVPGSFTVPQILTFPVPWDTEALDAFGIPPGPTAFATADVTLGEGINMTAAEGAQNRRFEFFHTGARWFDGNSAKGATNTIADPSAYRRVGHVDAADTIFAPISHTPIDVNDADPNSTDNSIMFSRQCMNRAMAFLDRMADISVTWTGGTIDVRDETHHVPVKFDARAGPTWGFLTTDANGNGVLDWHDFNYIDGAIQIIRQVDGGDCNAVTEDSFDPDGTATPVALASSPMLMPTSTNLNMNVDLEAGAALPQTGQGFGLFINGHRFIFEMGSLPADGTEWTLRTYQGNLGVGGQVADPSGYELTRDIGGGGSAAAEGLRRPALVPGLAFNYSVTEPTNFDGPVDLTQVHTVPDPYLGSGLYDRAPTSKQLMFVNLPDEATIRIYTLTGVLVDVIVHEDITGGGRAVWDIRNRNNQFVASGVYFFHVMTPDGDEHVGKFTIINQAGSN